MSCTASDQRHTSESFLHVRLSKDLLAPRSLNIPFYFTHFTLQWVSSVRLPLGEIPPGPRRPRSELQALRPAGLQIRLRRPISAVFMNNAQYAIAITNELRDRVHDWLDGLRIGHMLHLSLNTPSPLPVEFPFGVFFLSETLEWIHEYGAEQLRHIHAVSFVFQDRTNGPGSSVAWRVATTGDIDLGVFEIAAGVYDDAALPFDIDSALVLEAMLASLQSRAPVHLSSQAGSVPNAQPNAALHFFRDFELRTAGGTLVRHLGRRQSMQDGIPQDINKANNKGVVLERQSADG
ncbi:hypothetical protein DFH07DRAFT_944118 [Mycena maculata]|uniref:Uncharacterized protein n=1 Tax=Mycena maculata TaxID=230809 RepID=A0AAD7I9J5_9AGAR|nr:hypothetical protein DFH07DRAFT_944118 [Mycena maculata]